MTCTHCNDVGYTEHYQKQTHSHYTLSCQQCFGTGKPVACYAGIGSRKTPEAVLIEMSNIAMKLAMRGWTLRSGGADGADKAFERGADMMRGRKVIRGVTEQPHAMDHAARYHPAWDRCDAYARSLHARNSLVMLGDRLDHPVSFVVCWTPGAAVTGGTGQALRIAEDKQYHIPIFNLARGGPAGNQLWDWLDAK